MVDLASATILYTQAEDSMRQAKISKAENAAAAAFRKYGQNRQFDIFDLGKITRAGADAALAGGDVDAAVKAACDQYERKG